MADFEQAIALVLVHEGGYTPGILGDPGGETNFGISKSSFPDLDIKDLTVEQAKEIYKKDYWQFDDVEDQQEANCLFDCAVNQGLSRALTLKGKTLREIQLARLLHYVSLNKPKFYHSWFSRTLDV